MHVYNLAKIQWLQDPNQSNVDNLKDLRGDNIRYFRNKKKEYLKARIDEFETNSKIKISNIYGKSITSRRVTNLQIIY